MITLTENYRSTAPILNLADELLKSSVTNEALNSNKDGNELVNFQNIITTAMKLLVQDCILNLLLKVVDLLMNVHYLFQKTNMQKQQLRHFDRTWIACYF
jgi:flagellar biosynthesis protein FlhB